MLDEGRKTLYEAAPHFPQSYELVGACAALTYPSDWHRLVSTLYTLLPTAS